MTTWLKGSTTWANLVSDLTQLIAGEIADGSSVTCAVGDRWSRADALDDTLLSHSSADVSLGNMSNRAGYATLITYAPTVGSLTEGGQTFHQSVCRQTGIFTSAPGAAARWLVQMRVVTANSVSGNYSTAVVAWTVYNADTGAFVTSGSAGPTSGGTFTGPNGSTWAVSDPSGFLTVNTYWVRGADATYVGGVDWFGPLFQRRRANATFSVNPPGVSGTDYDANVSSAVATTSAIGYFSNFAAYGAGGYLSGLGIKTNTALTGALYTYSYASAQHSIRLANGSSNGLVDLYYGGRRISNAGTYYQVNGYQVASWLRVAQTLASVTGTMTIQYWLAVSPDRVVVVLNGDPAGTGKLTCNGLGVFTARYAYDKFPAFVGLPVTDYTADTTPATGVLNGGFTLYQQKIRQDASEGRDWQTGWSRGEVLLDSLSTDELSEPLPTSTASTTWKIVPYMGVSFSLGTVGLSSREEHPSRFDSKWHLYPLWLEDTQRTGGDTTMRVGSTPRGRIDSVPYIPGDSWVSGDELTDSVSGNKYFLVAADYHGSGCAQRYRQNTNNYAGGAAILENA